MADETPKGFVSVPASDVRPKIPFDIYANGTQVGFTLSDVNIQFSIVDRPQCMVHMSLTTAKALSIALSQSIQAFEKTTGHEIILMDAVKEAMEKDGII